MVANQNTLTPKFAARRAFLIFFLFFLFFASVFCFFFLFTTKNIIFFYFLSFFFFFLFYCFYRRQHMLPVTMSIAPEEFIFVPPYPRFCASAPSSTSSYSRPIIDSSSQLPQLPQTPVPPSSSLHVASVHQQPTSMPTHWNGIDYTHETKSSHEGPRFHYHHDTYNPWHLQKKNRSQSPIRHHGNYQRDTHEQKQCQKRSRSPHSHRSPSPSHVLLSLSLPPSPVPPPHFISSSPHVSPPPPPPPLPGFPYSPSLDYLSSPTVDSQPLYSYSLSSSTTTSVSLAASTLTSTQLPHLPLLAPLILPSLPMVDSAPLIPPSLLMVASAPLIPPSLPMVASAHLMDSRQIVPVLGQSDYTRSSVFMENHLEPITQREPRYQTNRASYEYHTRTRSEHYHSHDNKSNDQYTRRSKRQSESRNQRYRGENPSHSKSEIRGRCLGRSQQEDCVSYFSSSSNNKKCSGGTTSKDKRHKTIHQGDREYTRHALSNLSSTSRVIGSDCERLSLFRFTTREFLATREHKTKDEQSRVVSSSSTSNNSDPLVNEEKKEQIKASVMNLPTSSFEFTTREFLETRDTATNSVPLSVDGKTATSVDDLLADISLSLLKEIGEPLPVNFTSSSSSSSRRSSSSSSSGWSSV